MFRVARNAQLLGVSEQEMDFIGMMEKAMHFTVKFKNKLTGQGQRFSSMMQLEYVPFHYTTEPNPHVINLSCPFKTGRKYLPKNL